MTASEEREFMEYDVVIVGAGPSGLAASIRLKQLALENNQEISVCIVEKGSEVGAHILSGAVLEPRSLYELIPDCIEKGAPLNTPATEDSFQFLTQKSAFALPNPPQMHNNGNFIISLGKLCRWLAEQAEALEVEIYPGFAANEVLYDATGAVLGIATGDMGIAKDGTKKASYEAGIELRAKQTLFAEGCRGSLSKQIMKKFDLRQDCDPQTYGIGIKELWEVLPDVHQQGHIKHTIGWPLDSKTYGGSFVYHLENNQIAIGFVVGLDYQNPYINPYEEFQRFKNHPSIRSVLEGGKRIAYGARVLSEGGLQSIPKLTFAGGALIGDSAGFLNVAKIKGTHTAIKSGILAAEACFKLVTHDTADATNHSGQVEITAYSRAIQSSWVWDELRQVRNIRPAFKKGLWLGLAYSAVDTYLFRGKAPWTMAHSDDHKSLKPKHNFSPITYPSPDGVVSFDRLSSVQLSATHHEEDQPCHLKLADKSIAIAVNLEKYDAPEQRYCPAGVYEILQDKDDSNPRLQINAANCVHCKTCDIKDPTQNITWTPPEGGGGPNYPNM